MSASKWYHLHQTSVVTYDQLKLWVLKYNTGFIKNSKYGIKEKKKPQQLHYASPENKGYTENQFTIHKHLKNHFSFSESSFE